MIHTLPAGFTVRSVTMDDVKAVSELYRVCEIAIDDVAQTTEDILRHRWQSPTVNLAKDMWIVLAPDGRIVGYARIRNTQNIRIYAPVYLTPQLDTETGIAIGRHLLRLTQARAHEIMEDAPPDARITIITDAATGNTLLRQCLEAEEYIVVRSTWRMEIEMTEAPSVPAFPEGITLRSFVPGQDERATFDAFDESFHDHWGYVPENFEVWLHRSIRPTLDPTLWLLACQGDEVAGISLCEMQATSGWVDDFAVRRPWRKQGLGLALLRYSFSEFYRRGIHKVGLFVDSQNLTGATRLYERGGMHVVKQYDDYEKEVRAGVELSTQALAQ